MATRFADAPVQSARIPADELLTLLGPEKFHAETARQSLPPGVGVGLAWTEAGGEVLYVEAVGQPHEKELKLTGQLGQVMQESAQAAQSYVLAHARQLGLLDKHLPTRGVHIHVPAGATPKDGPSAGLTMAAVLASLYAGLPARADTAMTGEITLSGLILPVGGIKEKLLAAHRSGICRVILPQDNEKDVQGLPPHVERTMQFIYVRKIDQALHEAIPGLQQCGSGPVEKKASEPAEPARTNWNLTCNVARSP
jgi:ATP-dependent Lon protease